MTLLDEVARRALRAIEELRQGAGTVDKLLIHEGPELLDLDSTPQRVKRQIVADADRIVRLLQVHRLVTRRVGELVLEARRTRRGKPVRVLDVGAGSGGLLFRLEDWARRRRIPIALTGLEVNAGHVADAQRLVEEEGRRVRFVVGDARGLAAFPDASVDVAVSTLTLHHLPPGDAARMLAELDRVAAVNFFAFDLRRTLAALPAAWAFLRLGGFDAPSRHDTLVSLRRAYSVAEVEEMLRAAGVSHFAVRSVAQAFWSASRA